MVDYYFKVYIPSLDRRVSFRDINIREWININKSILNNDPEEIIQCFDLIIDASCIDKGLTFTVFDKVVILLSVRAYSISTFCTIKIKDNEEQKEFEHKVELNSLLDSLLRMSLPHKKAIESNDVTIEYGIPFYPVKDVDVINVVDYIHCIRKDETVLIDHTASRDELQQIVDSLDLSIFSEISEYARTLNQIFQTTPLYIIRSPWNPTRELIIQKMMLDFTMYDLLKMMFTENLHVLYRTLYDFSQSLNIQPEYTERLIPVEKDLIWGYYLKDQKDAENARNSQGKGGSFQP